MNFYSKTIISSFRYFSITWNRKVVKKYITVNKTVTLFFVSISSHTGLKNKKIIILRHI